MGQTLAIDGGPPVRSKPMPPRSLIGRKEQAAAAQVFQQAVDSGNAFGYGGRHEQQYEQMFAKMMGGGSVRVLTAKAVGGSGDDCNLTVERGHGDSCWGGRVRCAR